MNEHYTLNVEPIRMWLDREDRKLSYLSRNLTISENLVHRMMTGHIPKARTLNALAHLMGVEVSTLLLPKVATKAS